MDEFELGSFSVNTTGQLQVTGQTSGKVNLQTKRLEVNSLVKARLTTGTKYYVGVIQVCYRNSQVNHYGANVQQKWEFSQNIVSDSAASDERPWYGSFREHNTEGFRRRLVHASRNEQRIKFTMTDDFAPGVAKLETLANNQSGPNRLTQITRDQRFRLWLVAVPNSVSPDDPNSPGKYIRMAEVDWRYQYDITVAIPANIAHDAVVTINTDSLTTKIAYSSHGRGSLSTPGESGGNSIPGEANTAPIANDNQQLARYVNNVQTNIIVARR